MNKTKFHRLLVALAGILILINAYRIDYSTPSWSNNGVMYINILSMVLVIASMVLSMRKKDDNIPQ